MTPHGSTIGELARNAGVNVETVRFYERRGLIPKPPRGTSGYRLFPPDALRCLHFIRRAQELGFSLDEICELLALRGSPKARCAEVKARAQAKIADIDSRIHTLEAMKKTLRKLSNSCPGRVPVTECPILAALDKG